MATKLIAVLASASLLAANVGVSSATRAGDVLPGEAIAAQAQVDGAPYAGTLGRGETAGVAEAARAGLANGSCDRLTGVGQQSANGAAGASGNSLSLDGSCLQTSAASQSLKGKSGATLGILVGVLAIGGLAIALGGKSNG